MPGETVSDGPKALSETGAAALVAEAEALPTGLVVGAGAGVVALMPFVAARSQRRFVDRS
ncbi:MAG: hypothetical protein OXO56_13370 [Gammaproteobacteria bacterium]|nr:hypothetical protein [Gammaproteobacteria bacterium]